MQTLSSTPWVVLLMSCSMLASDIVVFPEMITGDVDHIGVGCNHLIFPYKCVVLRFTDTPTRRQVPSLFTETGGHAQHGRLLRRAVTADVKSFAASFLSCSPAALLHNVVCMCCATSTGCIFVSTKKRKRMKTPRVVEYSGPWPAYRGILENCMTVAPRRAVRTSSVCCVGARGDRQAASSRQEKKRLRPDCCWLYAVVFLHS